MLGEVEDTSEISRELFLKCNSNYIIEDVSPNLFNILGFVKEEFVGKNIFEIICNKEDIGSLISECRSNKMELIMLNKDNNYLIMDTRFVAKSLDGKEVIFLSMLDITELKNACKDRDSLKILIEDLQDIIYYYQIKPEVKFNYLSPSIDKILGEGVAEEAYKNPSACYERIHPHDFQILSDKINGKIDYKKPIMQRWRNNNGKYIWFEEYTTPVIEDGQVVAIHGVIRDIDEKKQLYNELEYRITHDTLTNVYSRDFFQKSIDKYDKEIEISIGLIIYDLDELKYINDTFGHFEGDILIKEAANILNKFSSDNVLVCRIGGDEFAVLIVNTHENNIKDIVDKIDVEILRFNNERQGWIINISKGYSFCESSIGNMQSVLLEADNNMYIEKNGKK